MPAPGPTTWHPPELPLMTAGLSMLRLQKLTRASWIWGVGTQIIRTSGTDSLGILRAVWEVGAFLGTDFLCSLAPLGNATSAILHRSLPPSGVGPGSSFLHYYSLHHAADFMFLSFFVSTLQLENMQQSKSMYVPPRHPHCISNRVCLFSFHHRDSLNSTPDWIFVRNQSGTHAPIHGYTIIAGVLNSSGVPSPYKHVSLCVIDLVVIFGIYG